MALKIQDLIDIGQFQRLQDRLNEIYSFPSAIIDTEGNILTATAWQDVCTKFHRQNRESEKECIKSDRYIAEHLHEANPAVSYRCPHGLIDNATPIVIEGVHYGNFFTGQFFLAPPDLSFFRAQAKRYGFAEEAYIDAVKRVPIWTQAQLDSYLFFIKGLIEVIAGTGLKNLREIEASKRVQESEERVRTILRTAMDGFWVVDMQGRLRESNETYCRISGYRMEELLTMHTSDLEAAETEPETAAHLQKIIAQGEGRFEARHRRKDGSIFDVEASVQYRPIDGGRLVVFLRDITERKRTEQETAILAEIGRTIGSTLEIDEVYARVAAEIGKLIPFDSLIVNLIDARQETLDVAYVSGLDIPGRRVGDSYPIRGTIAERVIQTRRGMIVQSDNQDDLLDKYPSLIVSVRTGMRSMMSVPLLSRDEVIGTLIMRSKTPEAYREENLRLAERIGLQIAGAIANAQLFGDLRTTERSLRESEARLREVIDHTLAGYFFIDRTGCFQQVNNAWLRMHGYGSADEVIGRHFSLTQPEADMETAQRRVGNLLAGNSIAAEEASRLCKDGSVGYHTFSAHPVIETGEISGLEGFIIDITAHRRLEEDYRTLFSEMLNGFALQELICDEQGNPADYRFLAVNPAFERMTGLKAEELVGRTILEVLPSTERHWIETYGTVALTGEPAFFANSRE